MKCRAVRARADKTEDGMPVVSLVMGNLRPVGCIDEVAWAELPPGMAREIGEGLIAAAAVVERKRTPSRSEGKRATDPAR